MTKLIDKLVNQKAATQKSWIKLQEYRNRDWGLIGQDWGIHDLNMITGGILPRKITTIAGLPSMGKTAMINSILKALRRWQDLGNPLKPEPCICTWEMEASELIDRQVSSETGLSSRELIMGAKLLTDSQLEEIKNVLGLISKEDILYQQESLGIEDLLSLYFDFVAKLDEKTKKDGIERQPIFIIDYVGLASFEDSGVRSYGINDFYRSLKQAANQTNGHFIILAQIDKKARQKDYPNLDDLADSQFIERNSDNVIIIHRPEHVDQAILVHPKTQEQMDSKGKMIVRVQKCRGFGTDDVVINCDVSRNRFWSLNHDYEFDYSSLYKDEQFWKDYFLKKR